MPLGKGVSSGGRDAMRPTYLHNLPAVIPVHVTAGDAGIQLFVLTEVLPEVPHDLILYVSYKWCRKSIAIARSAFWMMSIQGPSSAS